MNQTQLTKEEIELAKQKRELAAYLSKDFSKDKKYLKRAKYIEKVLSSVKKSLGREL